VCANHPRLLLRAKLNCEGCSWLVSDQIPTFNTSQYISYKHKEAECTKEMMDVKYSTQAKIADASREYQMNKAAFDQEVNTKKAEAELAYELQVFYESVNLEILCKNKM
jgi:hypothetical protein